MRNKLAQKIKLGAALLLMAGTSALAQISNQIYIPTPENIKARQEFQDNKFGIFLHWGIYSMTAQGEWYMNTHNINRDEYAKLASGFYPSALQCCRMGFCHQNLRSQIYLYHQSTP